jgi:hypothetical protein
LLIPCVRNVRKVEKVKVEVCRSNWRNQLEPHL